MEVVGKNIGDIKVVFSGAGASAIATAMHYVRLGVRRENLVMCDTEGVIYEGRTVKMDPYKARFASTTKARKLAEAIVGADVFVGLSAARALKPEMVATMARDPLVLALANPTPEIMPDEVAAVRTDAIVATGRSDYPNQVNNVLGFPFIFRGALDARATEVNEEMKMAATRALANLAREPVPESVARRYGLKKVQFGRDYLIPFPFDPRVLLWVAPAVAWAAVASGVAKEFIDIDAYREQLEARLGRARGILRGIINRRRHRPADPVRQPRADPRAGGIGAHFTRRHRAGGSGGGVAAPRSVCRIPVAAAPAKGDEPRRGQPPAVQPELLWMRHGGHGRGGRDALRADHDLSGGVATRARSDRSTPQGRPGQRYVHAGLRTPSGVLRRYHGELSAQLGAAGADRLRGRSNRAYARRSASGGHAFVLELRLGQG
jgi:hypothetical protein